MNLSLFRAIRHNLVFSMATAILQFGTTAAAGRLLTPADYGQFALAGSIIAISTTIGARGLSMALIKSPEVTRADLTNSYIVASGMSVLVAAILFAVGFAFMERAPAANAWQAQIVGVSGLVVIVNFLSTPNVALLQRDLKSATVGAIFFLGIVLGNGVVTLSLAYLGAGAWSLFFGALINALVVLAASHRATRPVLERRFDAKAIFQTLRGAVVISGLRLLDTIWLQLPILILTFQATKHDLGLFQRMHFFALLVFQVAISSTIVVIMPEVAKSHHDLNALRSQFLAYLKITCFAVAALVTPGWFAAPDIINVVFGSQWTGGAEIFRPTLFAGGFFALSTLAVVFKEACGLNRQRYVVALIELTTLGGLLAVVNRGDGVAVAICFALSAAAMTSAGFYFVCRWLKIPIVGLAKAMIPAALASASLSAALPFVGNALGGHQIGSLISLLCYGLATGALLLPFAWSVLSSLRRSAPHENPARP